MFNGAMCSMCLAGALVVAVPVNLLVIPISSGVGLHMIVIVALQTIALQTIVMIALVSNTVEATVEGLQVLSQDSIFIRQKINF